MRRAVRGVAVWAGVFCCVYTALAAGADSPDLPSRDLLSDAEAKSELRAQEPARSGAVRSRRVALNREVLDAVRPGQPATVTVRLFNETPVQLIVERIESRGSDQRTLVGYMQGGGPSNFTLVDNGGMVAAAFRTPGGGLFELRPHPDGGYLILELDARAVRNCGGSPGVAQAERKAGGGRYPDRGGSSLEETPASLSGASAYGCDDGSTLDLMVVYTQAAVNGAGGVAQLHALIDLAVADSNAAFVRSQIGTSLRVVHRALVNYTESGLGAVDGPRLFTDGDGHLDTVHPLRNQYGADCVSLWVQNLDSGGIGYYPDLSLTGIGASGFTVMRQDNAAYLTLAHEIGHNFWCAHDRAHAFSGDPFAEYSYGYREPGGTWYTIMAYPNDPPNPPGSMIAYFANPGVNWPGPVPPNPGPTGVAEGQPNPSDVARTFNELKAYVANFRATAVPGLPPVLYVRAAAAPGGDGLSWATAFNDLQDALCRAAGSNGAVQQIWVASGTYTPDRGTGDRRATFHLQDGLAVYGGFAGTETLLAQRNPATHVTVLSGDIGAPGVIGDNSYHIVTGTGTDASARLEGFTITKGNADGSTDRDAGGAGLLNYPGGSPTIAGCTFSQNTASKFGAGVYNYNAASPALIDCVFTDNTATGTAWPSGGGAVYNYDQCSPSFSGCTFTGNSANVGGAVANLFSSSAVLAACTFASNTAVGSDASGGALYNYSDCSPSLSDCTFSTNTAQSGAGIYSAFRCDLVASGCTLSGNTASQDGGGMYSYSECDVVLSGCTFSGNNAVAGAGMLTLFDSVPVVDSCTFEGNHASGAGNAGAGMYNYSNVNALITSCVFSGNSGSLGAGMANAFDCRPTLINCLFRGNVGTGGSSAGGGMANYANCEPELANVLFSGNTANFGAAMINQVGSAPLLVNCTLSGNTASVTAGGIYSDQSAPVLTNSILWGNAAGANTSQSAQIIGFNGSTATLQYSIVQGWTGSLGGTNNSGANPLFADADGPDNIFGTADDNPRPLAGSPAIDTGLTAAVPLSAVSDLDGGPRVLGSAVDRGVYEAVPVIPGDLDQDGDVDAADFVLFAACVTGPTITQPHAACTTAKLDGDPDVDMDDFGVFQRCYTGMNRPGDAGCAN